MCVIPYVLYIAYHLIDFVSTGGVPAPPYVLQGVGLQVGDYRSTSRV
jgi:hypothetical protein